MSILRLIAMVITQTIGNWTTDRTDGGPSKSFPSLPICCPPLQTCVKESEPKKDALAQRMYDHKMCMYILALISTGILPFNRFAGGSDVSPKERRYCVRTETVGCSSESTPARARMQASKRRKYAVMLVGTIINDEKEYKPLQGLGQGLGSQLACLCNGKPAGQAL